jgi:hypothetical protein
MFSGRYFDIQSRDEGFQSLVGLKATNLSNACFVSSFLRFPGLKYF